jgi:hypothetical protein
MSAQASREQVARSLLQRASKVGGLAVPAHLVIRLVYAAGDADFVFLDSCLTAADDRVAGQLVAFTERHVHVVDFTDVPRDGFDEGGAVVVTTVSRDALVRLQIAPVEGTTLNRNEDWAGGSLGGAWWPGAATLTYDGLPSPVTIPRGRTPEDFLTLHRALLDDLSRRC